MIAHLIRRIFGQTLPVPAQYRWNFTNLYFDIAWWGIFNGSIAVFLGVYISRLGASPFQVGLLTASPALVNVLFTFPASAYARGKPTHQMTRWAALITRLLYGLLIPLPALLGNVTQVWVILALTLIINIPGTMAAVIGNAFFAETVPMRWRGQVVGTRNALLAAASMFSSFMVGVILNWLPFTTGYQVVFGMGFFGLMMSVLHLFLIRPLPESELLPDAPPQSPAEPLPAKPGNGVRFDIMRGPFSSVLWVMFFLHLAVFLPNPMFPLYQVHQLGMSDQTISLGSSLFWIIHFIGSTQTGSLSMRLGFKKMTGIGMFLVGVATAVFAVSYQPWIYVICQVISGIAWSMVGGGLINYVLERVPPSDRPPYLAWFNMAVNMAVLLCGVLAPQVINWMGLFWGMIISMTLRFLAGLVILRWG